MKGKRKQYFYMLVGLFLASLSFNLFLSPSNLVAGGISGVAIVVRHFFNINESIFMLCANIILILVSFFVLGKEKTKNTILGALLFPIFTLLTENISNTIQFTIDPLLISILGGSLSGLGYGLIYRSNFTTGGTDILNQIAEKYFHIPMAESIMYVDGAITLLGLVSFGLTSMLYALIALFLISYVSNKVQLGINKNKVLYITSEKEEKIKKYLRDLGYDVTILDQIGGYSKKKGKMLICSIEEKDYYKIKEGILVIDPDVFIVVSRAYQQHNANVTIRNRIV